MVLSADESKRLQDLDTREALYAWELPQDPAATVKGGRGRIIGPSLS